MRKQPLSAEQIAVISSVFGLVVVLVCAFGTPEWAGIAFIEQEVVTLIPENSVARTEDFETQFLSEFKARTTLSITTFLALTVSWLVLAYCVFSIRRNFWALAFVGLVTLIVLVVYVKQPPEDHLFSAYNFLLSRAESFRMRDSPFDFRLVALGNALFVVAGAAFIASVWDRVLSFTLLPPDKPIQRDSQMLLDREKLRIADRELVWHLYMASALLVVSVTALHSYYSWPAVLVEHSQAEELRSLATLIAVLFGSVFTLLIVVVLGPAVLVLSPRIVSFAQIAVEYEKSRGVDRTVSEWLRENGLETTGSQQGMRALATLGPIMAGPLMELLKLTGG